MNVVINYGVVKSEQNFLFCEMWCWDLFRVWARKWQFGLSFVFFLCSVYFYPKKQVVGGCFQLFCSQTSCRSWTPHISPWLWLLLYHCVLEVSLWRRRWKCVFLMEKLKSEQPLLVVVNICVTSVVSNNPPKAWERG